MGRLIAGVQLRTHRLSLGGALGSLLAVSGRDLPQPYLMGVTGHAFRLTLDAVFSPGAPFELDFREMRQLWENLGVWLTRTVAQPSDERYEQGRQDALTRIRASLFRGRPAVAFDLLNLPEYGLVVGYDDERLACLTLLNPTEPQWMQIREWPPALLRTWTRADVIILERVQPEYDRRRAEVASLRFAVDHFWAAGARDMWVQHGQKAYQFWTAVLQSSLPLHGPAPGLGHSFNLAVLLAAREDAAVYLRELAGRYPEAPSLALAADRYAELVTILTDANRILPFPGQEGLDEEGRRLLAEKLNEALAMERSGVEEIERALRPLR